MNGRRGGRVETTNRGERLWSIWQRSKVATKNDKFFGKSVTKDGQGNIVASFIWIGPIAIGWYTPLNLEQAGKAMAEAKGIVEQQTNTMTQRFPR
jgi:hypothetical protein